MVPVLESRDPDLRSNLAATLLVLLARAASAWIVWLRLGDGGLRWLRALDCGLERLVLVYYEVMLRDTGCKASARGRRKLCVLGAEDARSVVVVVWWSWTGQGRCPAYHPTT